MSLTQKTGQEKKPTHAHPAQRTTSTPPTAQKKPPGYSAAEEKILFEDTCSICAIMEKVIAATIAQYAPDSPYAQQLKAKQAAVTVSLVQLHERLDHIKSALTRDVQAVAEKPTVGEEG